MYYYVYGFLTSKILHFSKHSRNVWKRAYFKPSSHRGRVIVSGPRIIYERSGKSSANNLFFFPKMVLENNLVYVYNFVKTCPYNYEVWEVIRNSITNEISIFLMFCLFCEVAKGTRG